MNNTKNKKNNQKIIPLTKGRIGTTDRERLERLVYLLWKCSCLAHRLSSRQSSCSNLRSLEGNFNLTAQTRQLQKQFLLKKRDKVFHFIGGGLQINLEVNGNLQDHLDEFGLDIILDSDFDLLVSSGEKHISRSERRITRVKINEE